MKLMKSKHWIFFLFLLGFLSGCQKKFSSVQEYYAWLNQEESGMVREKKVGNLAFEVKYLAPEYLAIREAGSKATDLALLDSLKGTYKNSLTFLLTFSHVVPTGRDIMFDGISSKPEYTQRMHRMNFGFDEMVFLNTDEGDVYPKLTSLENVYGATDKRAVFVVFSGAQADKLWKRGKELDLVLNDEIFGTGIIHFRFNREDLESMPAFWF